jgi:UTP--glucose-1-phosphate uridylyltransferase
MNSFNTDDITKRIIRKYADHDVNILTFNQSKYPRITKDSMVPVHKNDDSVNWYPPGHGDLFESLNRSGLLDSLIAQGKEYLFVSNIDNLGAIVDLGRSILLSFAILQELEVGNHEFIMEVTNKTSADIKGGTIIGYEGHVRLLEIAQVPNDHLDDFKSVKKFKIFNTNNLWMNLKAMKRVITNKELNLEVIVNQKVTIR